MYFVLKLYQSGRTLLNYTIECNKQSYLLVKRTPYIKLYSNGAESSPQEPLRLDENRPTRTKLQSIIQLMRWDKPTGTILALTPALWSLSMASPITSPIPNLELITIFTLGAIVARGMGCTINDILDRKYDRLVQRTKSRPIACGDISAKEGLAYLAVQSALGLYILCLNNPTVIGLGFISVGLISCYPLFKRFTDWPQVALALTMNWGVLMGYAAVKGTLGFEDLATLLPLYASSFCWTLYYDTIYAHQDKTDDMFIGVKSSALRLGPNTKKFLYQMSGAMCFSLALSGYMTEQLWPYYLTVSSVAYLHANQIRRLNLNSQEECWTAFNRQKYIGILILSGILFSNSLR